MCNIPLNSVRGFGWAYKRRAYIRGAYKRNKKNVSERATAPRHGSVERNKFIRSKVEISNI